MCSGQDLDLPEAGKGQLRVVSHADTLIRATLGGGSLDGFPVALGEQTFEFSIYPNGRIGLRDGSGVYEGHIDDWYIG